MQSKYSITTIPAEFAKEGLGEFVCAFSSKNAKDTYSNYKFVDYLFILGVLCVIITRLVSRYVSEDSSIFMYFTIFGGLILMIFVIFAPFRIYYYFKNRNCVKNIYIYTGGFILETYRKNRLKELRVFNYDDVDDIDFYRKDNSVDVFYLASTYKLTVDYYDYKKERWRKFKLSAAERNRYENPEKFTWLVLSMRYIYNTWLYHN